jgi:hypothetical protein
MILNIIGPPNAISTSIPLQDIVRLETCALGFFGEKVFNLYIIMKNNESEYFNLLSFARKDKFNEAYISLSHSLNEAPHLVSSVSIKPSTEDDVLLTVL